MLKRSSWLLVAALVTGAVHAQSQWPTAPVRVIVNVAAGGVADRTARLLGARLGETLGQPFVVENRAGGDGYIGFEGVAKAAPDGQTLCFSPGSSMMISPHLVRRADFDPLKMLTPIVPTVTVPIYLVVYPAVPAQNVAELIAYARANPGKLNYASAGNGTSPHLAGELFKRETGAGLTHVPYKGAGPALKDLLGGQVEVMFDPGIAAEHIKAGRLRILAVSGDHRLAAFPDAPTFAEAGVRGVDGGPYFGFYAPHGTPPAIIERLNREVTKLMQDPGVRQQLLAQGLELAPPMSPGAFAAYVLAESARYGKLLLAESARYGKLLPELGIRGQ